jgi:hypothetical protein
MKLFIIGLAALIFSAPTASAASHHKKKAAACNTITMQTDVSWTLQDPAARSCFLGDMSDGKGASYSITDCNSHMDFPNWQACSPEPVCDYLTSLNLTPACTGTIRSRRHR